MSSDSFSLSLLKLFHLSMSKTDTVTKINEGDTIMLRDWSWKKFGYSRKAYTMKNGIVHMVRLDDNE